MEKEIEKEIQKIYNIAIEVIQIEIRKYKIIVHSKYFYIDNIIYIYEGKISLKENVKLISKIIDEKIINLYKKGK